MVVPTDHTEGPVAVTLVGNCGRQKSEGHRSLAGRDLIPVRGHLMLDTNDGQLLPASVGQLRAETLFHPRKKVLGRGIGRVRLAVLDDAIDNGDVDEDGTANSRASSAAPGAVGALRVVRAGEHIDTTQKDRASLPVQSVVQLEGVRPVVRVLKELDSNCKLAVPRYRASVISLELWRLEDRMRASEVGSYCPRLWLRRIGHVSVVLLKRLPCLQSVYYRGRSVDSDARSRLVRII